MKRVGLLALVVGLIAVVGIAQEVTSVNVVGFNKVQVPPAGGFVQVAIQFDAFDPTLEGIFGGQLTMNNKAGNADNVYIWNPAATNYNHYWMKADGKFYNFNTGLAENPAVAAGEGLWIQSPGGAAGAKDVALMGEVVDVVTQSVDIVRGFQMLGYGFSSEIALPDLDFAADGATKNNKAGNADNIYVWTGAGYAHFFLKADGLWYNFDTGLAATAADVLGMGQGFWYDARNSFKWTEASKYIGNL